jgi:hypothetical protein
MPRSIVVAFTALDGTIEDSDVSGGTTNGGWAVLEGPVSIEGIHFKLGHTHVDRESFLHGVDDRL